MSDPGRRRPRRLMFLVCSASATAEPLRDRPIHRFQRRCSPLASGRMRGDPRERRSRPHAEAREFSSSVLPAAVRRELTHLRLWEGPRAGARRPRTPVSRPAAQMKLRAGRSRTRGYLRRNKLIATVPGDRSLRCRTIRREAKVSGEGRSPEPVYRGLTSVRTLPPASTTRPTPAPSPICGGAAYHGM